MRELHAADTHDLRITRDRVEGTTHQCRFSDAGDARHGDDRIAGGQRLFQALHDVGGLRPDKDVSAGSLGPERAFFESECFLVHAGPSALTSPQCTMRLLQQAVCGLGAVNSWSYVTILQPQNLP